MDNLKKNFKYHLVSNPFLSRVSIQVTNKATSKKLWKIAQITFSELPMINLILTILTL